MFSHIQYPVSEAGIIILSHQSDAAEGESEEDVDMLEPELAPLKWPRNPETAYSDLFEPEDSWYDAPPEGFSLAVSFFCLNQDRSDFYFSILNLCFTRYNLTVIQLSPFATMWMALFAWITSSSLAYIYGRDESFHEDYLSVNGKVYPCKIVLADGRSSEIKQTLAGCLARALPGLVADLRLPTPISTLEQGVVFILNLSVLFQQ